MKAAQATEEYHYLNFFGLRHNPFPVAPDAENFYLSAQIDEIITEIVHGIDLRKGFMVLTGEVGLGKTTIGLRVMGILEEKGIETSLVFHTTYQDVELLNEINRDFDLKPESLTLSDQMWALNNFLLEKYRQGKNCAIIIDDAQNLSFKTLELIRMISNLEAHHEKLVQILLIGQPEMMDKLNSRELRQLKSRIIIKKVVKPLNPEELKTYLHFKLNMAGNNGLITINKKALKKIYQFTAGNLRQVNILMDRCLYVALFHNTKEINALSIQEACTDLEQDESRNRGNKLKLILAIFVPIALIALGGAYLFYQQIFGDGYAGRTQLSSSMQEIAPASQARVLWFKIPKFKNVPTHQPENNSSAHAIKGNAAIPKAVIDFLAGYNLSLYKIPFFSALKAQRFEEVTESILDQTGYRLIRLEKLPHHIQAKYGTLLYSSGSQGNDTYYLFWKPTIRFERFYYNYKGQNIYVLQERLAKMNLYNVNIDGIVGKNLMQAIVKFQVQAGLPVTGYPDVRTVFLLCHQEANS